MSVSICNKKVSKLLILILVGNWDNVSHRTKYLKAFADYYGFDYLNPENWYCVTPSQARRVQVSTNLEDMDAKTIFIIYTFFRTVILCANTTTEVLFKPCWISTLD